MAETNQKNYLARFMATADKNIMLKPNQRIKTDRDGTTWLEERQSFMCYGSRKRVWVRIARVAA